MTAPLDRRRPPAVLVALGLALAGILPIAAATAADAAPVAAASTRIAASQAARPVVTVVPGDRRLALSWSRVSGAKRYTVEWSTSKKFTKKTTKRATTSSRTYAVTKLKLRTDYWVRVRTTVKGRTVTSKAVTTRLDTRAVGRVPITVKPAGANKVTVTWGKLPRGTSVTLRASWHYSFLSTAGKSWSATGIKPTERSRTLTVPAKFRKYAGSTTGNPVYVQAYYFNGPKKSTSKTTYGRPGATSAGAAASSSLRVATYNVGSISATENKPARTWEKRRASVARAITHANADVVAVQEATTRVNAEGVRQIEDLVARLGKGYALAYSPSIIGKAPGNQSKGDHLIVKTSRVKVLRSGLNSVEALLPKSQWITRERFFAWAHLEDKDTGAKFWIASLHLENDNKGNVAHRRAAALAIDAFLTTKRGSADEAIVLLGDLNSDLVRHRDGPQTALVGLGYVDTLAAPKVTGGRWGTSNNQEKKAGGYPAKPFAYAFAPNRIDYIFVKGAAGVRQHTNQVILSGGKFDERYRGSDHNLQHADIVLN